MSHSSHREGVEPFATLCPGNHPAYCQCDLIARVEERAQDKWTVIARGQYDLALRDAVEAVMAVNINLVASRFDTDRIASQFVAAIEALGGER